jgi:hypothetical protein
MNRLINNTRPSFELHTPLAIFEFGEFKDHVQIHTRLPNEGLLMVDHKSAGLSFTEEGFSINDRTS